MQGSFRLLAAGYLVDPVAALLVDELQDLQVQRLGLGEGQHLRNQGLAASGIAQEVGAHHVVGQGLQGVGDEVVVLHPLFEIADQAVHVAFHGEVLVGDVKLPGAHQSQFVEVGDVQGDVGFARAGQFAQHGSAFAGLGKQGVGKALEVAALFITGLGAPELVFVFADGLHAVTPYHRHDQGFGDMRW